MYAPPPLFCVGYGYCARAAARRLIARQPSSKIHATSRDPGKAEALASADVEPHPWPLAAEAIPEGAMLLISAPPTAEGDPVLNACGAALAERRDLAWVGYLSTTAVYGDRAGGWVDESDPPAPTSERGRWRAEAEAAWLALPLPVHVFRLAGIYGPGRGPFEKVRAGKARRILKPGQVFGRIHVDDVATTLLASMDRPNPGAVYNVTDDLTCPPEDVLAHAADLLGLPPPPAAAFDDAVLSPMARSFYGECKRVRNDRIKAELGVSLAYPTYREGLAAILAKENARSA